MIKASQRISWNGVHFVDQKKIQEHRSAQQAKAWDPYASEIETSERDYVQREKLRKVCRDLTRQTSSWDRYSFDKQKAQSTELLDSVEEGTKAFEAWEGFSREVFSRLLNRNEPEALEEVHSGDRWATRYHSLMSELPEFSQLKARTVNDPTWSALASVAISEKLQDSEDFQEQIRSQKEMEEKLQSMESLLESLDGADQETQDAMQDTIKQAEKELEAAQKALEKMLASSEDSATRQALRVACNDAATQIQELEGAMQALGMDKSAGQASSSGQAQIKAQLTQKLLSSKKLQEIAKIAGRMKAFSAKKKRTKSKEPTEVHSVETGNNTMQVLTSELALLNSPETETLFFQRYISSSLQQYRLEGKKRVAKGPIIVAVDNSGSMNGPRELWSKGLALALLEIARREKRDFILWHFDTAVCSEFRSVKDKPLEPFQLIEAMEFFSGGGTDLVDVISRATQEIEQGESKSFREADVILITDGAVDVPESLKRQFKESCTRTGASLFGLVIAGYDYPILELGGQATQIQDLNEDSKLEQILTI